MRRAAVLLALLACVACSSCFRTTYNNFTPLPSRAAADESPPAQPTPAVPHTPPSSWQHFFVWGWFPTERRIDAGKACGGAEHVKEINTRQTFLQGLIEAFAGYYVNIYAPYTGAVVCDQPGQEP